MLPILLNDLEKHLGLKATKDKDRLLGGYTLSIPDNLNVGVQEFERGICLQANIAPLTTVKDREEFFSYLMRANFLGQGVGGGSIGLDPDEKYLTLSLIIPYEVNYRLFRDRLEDFVNYLVYWKEAIEKY